MLKRNLSKKDINNIAKSFRSAIYMAKQNGRFSRGDRMNNFPSGCCDDSCDLLAYYLCEKYSINTQQVNGIYRDDNHESITNHAYIFNNK